jgi:hypothetical protein
MPTPRLGLTEPAINAVGWGVTVNNDFDLIDSLVEILSNKNAVNGYAGLNASGKLAASTLPVPAAAALGGVFSKAAVAHNFLTSISSVDGSIGQAQPSAADLSNGVTGTGAVVLAASPTLTGTVICSTLKAPALTAFSLSDPLGVSHFFVSSSSPYQNTFVNGNGAGSVFLGSASKTSIADTTGNITMSGATSGTTALQAAATASGTNTLPNGGNILSDTSTNTVSNKTLAGTTPFNRLRANQGTALVVGDVSGLTNFGTTATVSAVSGTDAAGTISITSSGTGQIANGQFTLTFHDGTWTTAPVCVANRAEGAGPNSAPVSTSATATNVTFIFNGVAVAGTTYTFNFICVGK